MNAVPPVMQPRSLRREAAWVVVCRALGIMATLASNILAARLLGPAQFGTYLLVTTVIALGSLLAMGGLNEAALRFVSESLALGKDALARGYVRRALAIVTIASTTSAVVIAAGLGLFEFATAHVQQPVVVVAVALGIAALAWQQLGAELSRAYGDLRLASLFSGGQTGGPVSNLLFLIGLGAAAFASMRLDAILAVGLLVSSLCITCPLLYVTLWRTSRTARAPANGVALLSAEQQRELIVVGGMLLANQLLAFATQQLDIWLAGGLLSSGELGLYAAAKRSLLVAAMPVQMAMLTIVSTIPRLHAQSRAGHLQRVVRSAATVAAVPSLVALGALTIFPEQILGLVLGTSYSAAASTLLVLVVGHYVLVLSGNPQHVLTMTGRHRAVLAVNVVAALVLVSAGSVGAALFGAPGLAAGSAASLALQNLVLWWLARRELGIWTHVDMLGCDAFHVGVTPKHEVSPAREARSNSTLAHPQPSPVCPP